MNDPRLDDLYDETNDALMAARTAKGRIAFSSALRAIELARRHLTYADRAESEALYAAMEDHPSSERMPRLRPLFVIEAEYTAVLTPDGVTLLGYQEGE